MTFEFATAARILFGPGTLKEVAPAAAEMGRCALVVTGADPKRAEPLHALLHEAGLHSFAFAVPGEPTTEMAREGVRLAREGACDVVIGFGGGSALDAAKALAVLAAHEGDPLDYMEVVGRGQKLTQPGLPCIAIPTTAGTGAEVTRNAVILSPEHRAKASLRSPFILPRLALVDPELTFSMPADVTASTGLDALTQLIEPFVSTRRNPLVDGLCRAALPRAARSLRQAYAHGDDPAAREGMALASLFGGLALANAGLGAVHAFAAPAGGMFPAPHGAICARLLPCVMAANVLALREREPDNPALERYRDMAVLLTGDPSAAAEDGTVWVEGLAADLGIPGLSTYGMSEADIPLLVEKASATGNMRVNPIRLIPEELAAVVAAAL